MKVQNVDLAYEAYVEKLHDEYYAQEQEEQEQEPSHQEKLAIMRKVREVYESNKKNTGS